MSADHSMPLALISKKLGGFV
ncbi:hypothetical protein JL09_g5884 [Pichia kudriavzevii]|uniref:Uncharacterized protein n=1 Tax=Pichia kudriavzevii TaxID=4909 RepID=A0A099NST2_PICKU|nr:hypothetical protein JL09_g5884 [Pichia kudriavzevii]